MFSALTFNQESIVNNGLVLYLDAADKTSYPNIGTNWYDLSGNGYGELSSAINFSSTDGRGSLGFDVTDEFVSLTSTTFNTSVFNTIGGSLSVWFKISQTDLGTDIANLGGPLMGYNNGSTKPILNIVRSLKKTGTQAEERSLIIASDENGGNNISLYGYEANSVTKYADGNWHNIVLIVNSGTTDGHVVYVDGSAITLTYEDGNSSTSGWIFRGTADFYIGTNSTSFSNNRRMFFGGDIGVYMAYNRALTQNEVLQNYNALKDRFR